MKNLSFEKLFPRDILSKRERIERTLHFQPVDRVALHDQLSYNPGVIADYTHKRINGFDYTLEDICQVIRGTLDACFPPVAPGNGDRYTDSDGFVLQNDYWNEAIVSRPFNDIPGASQYLRDKTRQVELSVFDSDKERESYLQSMHGLQAMIGETVIIDYPVEVGFCGCWTRLGLELFSYLYAEKPEVISSYIEAVTTKNIRRLHAIADSHFSPFALIAEDFASKNGPIFSPALLRKEHFPRVRRLATAWHEHGIKAIYHSDGNWKKVIPDLISCGVDGFYCLEPSLGMDLVELSKTWPEHVWMGGVDGVDLMERGAPEQVRKAVRRQILETQALEKGGVIIGTSSEVNPPIQPVNFRAMVETVDQYRNEQIFSADNQPH